MGADTQRIQVRKEDGYYCFRSLSLLVLNIFFVAHRAFCSQKPGDVFNGVTMGVDKTVLDGTANSASVLVFMTYLCQRRCKSGKRAGKDVLDKKTLEVAMEALADLKVQQMALEPHRFPTAEDRRYSFYVLYY